MRLGVAFQGPTANAYYRAIYPMAQLERRGHTVHWPHRTAYDKVLAGVPPWDLLHLQQFVDDDNIAVVRRLRRAGVAVVWDTDDDLLSIPKGTPGYRRLGGRRKLKRVFAQSVEIAREAHLLTTTNEHLADLYRDAGVTHVAVIENYLGVLPAARTRQRRQGVTVGIVAAHEHREDIAGLRIAEALRRVLDAVDDVTVLAIGVDLEIRHDRYTHRDAIPFTDLLSTLEAIDVGLAPLIDTPFNRARSNIKLKEYAAAGAAWLASPIGPYAGAREAHGGLLVDDGGWEQAILTLVNDPLKRRELASAGRTWAQRQTIREGVGPWEVAFRDAVVRARREAAMR
ncbi:hypothetical protein VSS74_04135 [Conexibacter stalactiti]|uniref:Glycosyl transferase n=1 Tax=Conexibacter stalactiti TaxID=1940611 RepID=A0ABU4HLD3_9ACTN|nr:hypothetical protein [Conexibacter stalactiti]MDW5593512.1 hypothetical protein [Conexibacter stalactiti]MEC5034153.1 hypothetical protein [Conexibacter stalactiti]